MNAHMIPITALLTTLAGLTGTLAAQNRHVVPVGAENLEQPTKQWLPGLGYDGRTQIVIDAANLTPLVGHNLTGLEFRRDTSRPFDHPAGTASVIVRIGAAATASFGATTDFGANSPNAVEVFRGTLSAAASSVSGYVGWVDPHVLRLQFTPAFAYAGGPLAIDIEGSSAAHVWWPVDAARELIAGDVLTLGAACGPRAQQHLGRTLDVGPSTLVAGSTTRLTSFTSPEAGNLLLFGVAPLPTPLNLGVLGSPGCWLVVDPIAVFAPVMTGSSAVGDGIREFHLTVPADPAFLSAPFVVQALELGAAGLSTSEALACRVAGGLPSLGCAVVRSDTGGAATVSSVQVPVLGILHD